MQNMVELWAEEVNIFLAKGLLRADGPVPPSCGLPREERIES